MYYGKNTVRHHLMVGYVSRNIPLGDFFMPTPQGVLTQVYMSKVNHSTGPLHTTKEQGCPGLLSG